jgi:hypothetical protein
MAKRNLQEMKLEIQSQVDEFIESYLFDLTLIGITAGLWIYCWYCAQSGMRYITTGMWMFTTWGLTFLLLMYYGAKFLLFVNGLLKKYLRI